MNFAQSLIPARLIRRYKRFLADAVLEETGEEITAHAPNPGAMLGLAEPGMRIWLEPNDDPKKKLKYGWRIAELEGGHMAGIDTGVPNKVVGEALRAGLISEVRDYPTIRPEVRYGSERSRIDFLLTGEGKPDVYLEVKNVHLRREGDWAEFPDCVTARGTKHMRELAGQVRAGHRAAVFYLVQRTDCARMRLATDLDPAYAEALKQAMAEGVEVLCYDTEITKNGVFLRHALPFQPPE